MQLQNWRLRFDSFLFWALGSSGRLHRRSEGDPHTGLLFLCSLSSEPLRDTNDIQSRMPGFGTVLYTALSDAVHS